MLYRKRGTGYIGPDPGSTMAAMGLDSRAPITCPALLAAVVTGRYLPAARLAMLHLCEK